MVFDLDILDSLGSEQINEILNSWGTFYACTDALIKGNDDLSTGSKLTPLVALLCKYGLLSLVEDLFLQALEFFDMSRYDAIKALEIYNSISVSSFTIIFVPMEGYSEGTEPSKDPMLEEWMVRAKICDTLHDSVRIALIGKYTGLSDSYLSVLKITIFFFSKSMRREKISQRVKFLQDLVPRHNKVTRKMVMLDEIINYVQSLQRQVKFLSMKLAALNPGLDFNIEGLLAKDLL
ncbi:hypothetical protein J5N97_024794 [Dioscorea zingiberensis]|uniref:BHLH domain-containing protein n=1 Tax=Dioscorea zingiberensis TaxID=325984 RepID=A0A9D5H982_9LILI|nr:hypothetical protein J5N97_024794 [Dioscorea zingiberensis]